MTLTFWQHTDILENQYVTWFLKMTITCPVIKNSLLGKQIITYIWWLVRKKLGDAPYWHIPLRIIMGGFLPQFYVFFFEIEVKDSYKTNSVNQWVVTINFFWLQSYGVFIERAFRDVTNVFHLVTILML